MTTQVTCSAIQVRMAALVAGGADRRERLELESHARRCARCAAAHADLITASIALDRAFGPLRDRTTTLSPARVWLATRRPQPLSASVRLGRVCARVTEAALAAAVTAFAFAGAGAVAPARSIVSETAPDRATAPAAAAWREATAARWFRIGRYATTPDLVEPPMERPSAAQGLAIDPASDRAGQR